MKKGSAGGIATARVLRERALKRYYSNPKMCLNCQQVIPVPDGVKVTDMRRRKFCNRSCAAAYNNAHYPKKDCSQSPTALCQDCGDIIYLNKRSDGTGYRVRKFCERCRAIHRTNGQIPIEETTKGELFKRAKNWQAARSVIRYNAKLAYIKAGKPLVCSICGYDKHVNIAHIKAVNEFSDDTIISIINHPDNLAGFCPNHHWEYDHNML